MTNIRLFGLIAAALSPALGCVCLSTAWAEDEDKIKTPQPAALQFTNGRILRGSVVEVNDKEVRFQLNREGTVPAKYKLDAIRGIQTADGIWLYNKDKGRFEKMKMQAAKTPPAEKAEERPRTAAAAEAQQSVVAEGVGGNADEALKDAFREAIRQVVGTLVDSETRVKDDKIISDKVLTYNDGVIKRFDKISEKEERGLVRVRIRATVERRNLVARLREFKITVKAVEGKDVAAEVMTRGEARANATELLQKELKELPKVLVAEARKIDAKDYDEDTKSLRVDVSLKGDADKYKAFLTRLLPLLDKINLDKGFHLVVSERKKSSKQAEDRFYNDSIKGFADHRLAADQKGWYLWVLSNIDAQAIRTRWEVYLIDSDLRKSLSGLNAGISILVSLQDADGQAIVEDEIALTDPDIEHRWLACQNLYPRDRDPNICLAPMALYVQSEYLDYKPVGMYRRHIKLTVEELKKVKDIKCSIVVRPVKDERKR